MEDFLTKNGPNWKASSRNQHRSQLNSLWTFADKHGYCSEKTGRHVEWLRETERTIGILQPSEAARLLALAPPKLVIGLAIGLFAGLRVSEICKLDWKQIDLRAELDPDTKGYGFIHVLPENAKTARNRFVTILPNLAAWLRPFEKDSGKVVVAGGAQYFDELRQAVVTQAGIADFPNNALRHSYASYHLAYFRKLSDLIDQMGHAGSRQIFAHYRALVRPDQAREYWEIAPFSRPEVAEIHSFSPEAYPWCRKVGRIVEGGEWIDGIKNLAHYFGVDYRLPYSWFENVPDCPPRPADDRFHIPTWQKFVRSHPDWKSNCYAECPLLFYVSWYCGDRGGERRTYFATEKDAVAAAGAKNRELLAKELLLQKIDNVVEFTQTKSQSADIAQSPLQLPATENASIGG